jgi:biotin operon repressor
MSKKMQILNLLLDHQPHSSEELIKITHRFSAVIHKLREEGYDIETISTARYQSSYQLQHQIQQRAS